MGTVYFNIVNPDGTVEVVYPDDSIILVKNPNQYDDETIEVWTMTPGVSNELDRKIGYVANSTHTVPLGTYSAGRLYDKVEDRKLAIIIVSDNSSQLRIGEVEL